MTRAAIGIQRVRDLRAAYAAPAPSAGADKARGMPADYCVSRGPAVAPFS